MDSSIVLATSQRNRLLALYRNQLNPHIRLRAHILLLLADGYAWSLIAAVLFCSTATIARWKERFEQEGLQALLEEERGRPCLLAGGWSAIVVRWVRRHMPLDFGYRRSRWCCATLTLVLFSRYRLKVAPETVRRWLRAEGLVWRRPRPVLALKDPQHPQKPRKIRHLLRHLPEDELAVFCDEVGLNTKTPRSAACGCGLEQWGHRIELHFLPKRAPQTNPIERAWWHLHEEITRNHRCKSIEQLVSLVLQWIEDRGPFEFEGHICKDLREALNG